jgi:phosphoserine phosphatase
MELLTDVSQVTIPVENLKRDLNANLAQLQIKAVFQDEHVFIKRKRVILFHMTRSFMDRATLGEIARHSEIGLDELARSWRGLALVAALAGALAQLDGLPLDVLNTVLKSVTPSAGSQELVQTLKVMGYRIVLASAGFSFVTDHLARQLDLDSAYGTCHGVDDDARVLLGELQSDTPSGHDLPAVLARVAAAEQVPREDITVISDEGCQETPGIRLLFNLEILLNCYNQHAMSREHLLGLLGSFGVPRCE